MDQHGTHQKRPALTGRTLRRLAGGVALAIGAAYLLAVTIIATPWAAARLGRLATDTLHTKVTVGGVALQGASLTLSGVVIADPAGFGTGELAACREMTIAPAWGELLAGKRSFSLIRLRELRVALRRNKTGSWNFSGLVRQPASSTAPVETFVHRLVLEEAAVAIDGRSLDKLSVTVNELATRGATPFRLIVSFRDGNNNLYRLEGKARLGTDPSLDLSLAAPSLSLQGLGLPVAAGFRPITDRGIGALSLHARLAAGALTVRGHLGADRLAVGVKGGTIPLQGNLKFSGTYDMNRDTGSLDTFSLELNDLLRLSARGTVEHVRHEAAFTAEVASAALELGDIRQILPESLSRGFAFRGTLAPVLFRCTGDRHRGIVSGGAILTLRNGTLSKGKRSFCTGVDATFSLARKDEGWAVAGRVVRKKNSDNSILQALSLPVRARLSPRFVPTEAVAGPFSATVAGVLLTGEASYRSAAPEPLAVRLEAPRVALAAMNDFLRPESGRFSAGNGSAFFRGGGRLPGSWHGEAGITLSGAAGVAGGSPFALGGANLTGSIVSAKGGVTAVGIGTVTAGMARGTAFSGSLRYRYGNGGITVTDGSWDVGRNTIRFAEIRAAIPPTLPAGRDGKMPARLVFGGGELIQGETRVLDVAGDVTADVLSQGGKRWLEGRGRFGLGRLSYRQEELGAVTALLSFDREGATAELSGKILDGTLRGKADIDPFGRAPSPRFELELGEANCARLAGMLPAGGFRPSGGRLTVRVSGRYDPARGLHSLVAGTGKDISVTGKGGKTLLSAGRLELSAELAHGELTIGEGMIGVGTDLAVKFQGKVASATAPDRKGEIAFALSAVPVDTLLASFAAFLPRALQEATATGSISGKAALHLEGGEAALDGAATITGGSLTVPGQRLAITGINGTIPCSLVLAGSRAARAGPPPVAARKNYPLLLHAMQQGTREGDRFTVGSIRFGGMEVGETVLTVRAGGGTTEITSLSTALYGGSLLGRGFFGYHSGMDYGGDLLVNDLSLRKFCDSYPALKGYMTGRVDGIVTLGGTGTSLTGMTGIVTLWTRPGEDEKMLVSREFLQKLAGKKLKGIFFRTDRPYDRGEISASLGKGFLTFDVLNIEHTNLFGVQDLDVSVAPVQNRIALSHLIAAIREAAARGKAAAGGAAGSEPPAPETPATEFKWEE